MADGRAWPGGSRQATWDGERSDVIAEIDIVLDEAQESSPDPDQAANAAGKVVAKLLTEDLVEEIQSRGSLPVWRRDGPQAQPDPAPHQQGRRDPMIRPATYRQRNPSGHRSLAR